MKKLYWLNAMVNLFWIVSFITIPIACIAMIGVFFIGDSDVGIGRTGIDMTMNGNRFSLSDLPSKVYFSLNMMVYLGLIYVMYLFKKMISYFLKAKIFDEKVIRIFQRIGFILLISGVMLMVYSFGYNVYARGQMYLEFGISQNAIMIFMGVFFMVLGEIFKISKNIKLENDLTI